MTTAPNFATLIRRSLARDATDGELEVLERLLAKHRDHYRNHESEAAALESNGLWQTPEGVDLVEVGVVDQCGPRGPQFARNDYPQLKGMNHYAKSFSRSDHASDLPAHLP